MNFIARWWFSVCRRREVPSFARLKGAARPAMLRETAAANPETPAEREAVVESSRLEATVRPMFVSDVDQVLMVETRSFATPWSRSAFYGELLENPRARYLVALDGRRVIGYIGLWLILDEAHVTNVAVHPDYRGRGIGRTLMTQAQRVATANGARRMTLEVRKSNNVAKNLYESLGYYSVGIRPGYYRDNNEDAIIMWKDDPGGGNDSSSDNGSK